MLILGVFVVCVVELLYVLGVFRMVLCLICFIVVFGVCIGVVGG